MYVLYAKNTSYNVYNIKAKHVASRTKLDI